MPLIAKAVKRGPIVKENITPQFVKNTSNVVLNEYDNHVTYHLFIVDTESIRCIIMKGFLCF